MKFAKVQVQIEISGYAGNAAGPRFGETRALIEFEVAPNQYPTVDCGGYPDFFKMHPFRAWDLFEIDLKDGTSLDSGAETRRQLSGYPAPSGTDVLVIHGGGTNAECLPVVFAVTMPPATDPRNLAGPTDAASYRFFVHWYGKTPAKVYFDVEGGNDAVIPSFTFNPANIQTSPISVIMDVTTRDADPGEYPLTVDAWVVDPDTGLECHAVAVSEVILVVSEEESRASDLGLVQRFGQVQVLQERNEAGGRAAVIQTGNDGALTLRVGGDSSTGAADSGTTLNLGSNTAIKEYDHVDHFAKLLEDKAKTAETLAWTDNDLLKYKEPGAWERLKSSIQEFVKEKGLASLAGDFNVYSCLFAALDANTAEICGGQSAVYVSQGDLRLEHKSSTGQAIDRVNAPGPQFTVARLVRLLMTSNALIIPNGTELTVSTLPSAGSSTTTVTMIGGSALVIDLASEKIQVVNAGERYSMETTFAGQTASSIDTLESISMDSIPHWWKIQIGDYATARDIETEGGAKPVDRTSIFSDDEYGAWMWVQFLNVPAHEEHLVEFKIYAPDGSFYATGNYTMIKANSIEYWDSYGPFRLLRIDGFEASQKPGRWHTDVYYDGDFVKEIPFYIAKYTLVKDQSVTYRLVVDVRSSNAEVKAALENSLVPGLVGGFSGAENIERIDDIEWIKTTILDASKEGELRSTLKLKGKGPIDAEPRSLSSAFLSSFIPTIGIDGELAIPTSFGDAAKAFPSEVRRLEDGGLRVGSSAVEALQFSGSKELVEGDSHSNFGMYSHYEKHTGILVNNILSGSLTSPEVGTVEIEFGVVATEISIPNSLTITSIQSEIQQNQAVVVSGTTNPAISEGQVVLTYQRNDSDDPPIKRTVTVANGAFSDSYNMEKDGTYTVSAEYLGSRPFLSSAADTKTLTVSPSECLIATAAFGSELTPQVQFLRNFRDNHILSTTAGSSFMNVFNTWYYSFSPHVADYERERPWLQAIVRAGITPLLGILTVSGQAYDLMPGEYGAVTAGIVASSMIGAVYFWPAGFVAQRIGKHNHRMSYSLAAALTGISIIGVSISLVTAGSVALMTTTSLLVLTVVATSALLSARLIGYAMNRFVKKTGQHWSKF